MKKSTAMNFISNLESHFSTNSETIAERLESLKHDLEDEVFAWETEEESYNLTGLDYLDEAGVDISDIDTSSFDATINALKEIASRVNARLNEIRDIANE